MARNANYDKARLQAVGIYRKASPNAFINHGVCLHSGGDYRAPEGSKACYAGKLQVPEYDHRMVKKLAPQTYRGDNRKRSNSCPQERGTLTASGCRAAQPAMRAVVTWDSYAPAASALIKRAK